MKFKYVRIQGRELAANTMVGKGVFSMCVDMLRGDEMEEEDLDMERTDASDPDESDAPSVNYTEYFNF